MKIENELGLPEPLVNAIRNDGYSKGDCDFSVTELIKPVRIASLTRKYGEHLSEDASDRIFSLIGQSIHVILERAANSRYVVENRYYADFGGVKVGGQIDVYDTEKHILSDWKVCSRFVVNDGVKPDWQAQASINALIMRENGVTVTGAQIVAIFRDWSKMAAQRTKDYPARQVVILPIKLWPADQTRTFILERIKAHQEGRENPPVCTPEERWERPTKWALMKKGQKRAVKLYEAKDEAESAAKESDLFKIEERPGENIRCLNYCNVCSYCDFGREQVQLQAAQ